MLKLREEVKEKEEMLRHRHAVDEKSELVMKTAEIGRLISTNKHLSKFFCSL
jgi:hypothetical protein